MTRRGDRSGTSAEPYSPHRRTALVLTGSGTAGAYHAGVLRALHEAGVKIDLVGGRGMGAVSALFAAIDGGARLWDDNGFWKARAVAQLYPWHPLLRLMTMAVATGIALIAIPLAAMAVGLVVFPIDFMLKMLGASGGGLAASYLRLAESAFAPTALPTWLPRLAVVVFGSALAVALIGSVMRAPRRRGRGPVWWRLVPVPLSGAEAAEHCWASLWDLLRGAAHVSQPNANELARRYAELLSENLGQPGFCELVITVHDLDTRRDLVCAIVAESRREDLSRRTMAESDVRRAEMLDLAGVSRGHLADAIQGSLAIPLATPSHSIQFESDSFWRGEVHRLCDRPGSLLRLVDEIEGLDVEQVILVSATAEIDAPHTLVPPRLDGRGRIGEHIHSLEAAAVRDLLDAIRPAGLRLFVVRPSHNPVGPFDLRGGFDDRSDRRQPLTELMARGYEDAYRQFVDPVMAPSGERLGRLRPSRAAK
jgi:hypothetical protein